MGQPEDPATTTLVARRAVAGDLESLGVLLERFNPPLLALARRRLAGPLKGHYDAEDLVADTWVRTLPRLPDLQARDGRITPVVMRFLSSALVNRCNTLLQKLVHGKPTRVEFPDPSDGSPVSRLPAEVDGAITAVVRKEAQGAVHEAIERITEPDREIVYLRAIEQVPVREVAALVGLSETAVKKRYARALKQLTHDLPRSVFSDLAE